LAAARRIIAIKRTISAGKPLNPPAFNYDIDIGEIFLEGNPSGYDHWHDIEVVSPEGVQGGYYDKRV